ncbi:MAG: redoxin domain-containing protein [Blastocatellia bacterium]
MKKILPAILFVALSFIQPSAQTVAGNSLAMGKPAPDFTLKDLSGQLHSLQSYRGKTAVVVFLSTECPFSNAYHERLLGIAKEYASRNVALIGVNSHPTESVEEIRQHAKQNLLDFPLLKDEGSKIADAYGATRTPEVFVVDPAGMLRYHGRIDNAKDVTRVKRNDLREALDEMLTGKAVSQPETKSFGCPIKMIRKGANAEASAGKAESRPASPSLPFANSFVPQKKPAAKRPTVKKAAASGFTPKVGLLKPADFAKYKDSLKGQVLVLNFWATWCGPCVAEFPEFVALDAKYRDKGLKMVGISADDTTDLKTKVTAFLKEQKAPFENFVQDTDDPQEMIDVVDKDWAGILPATFVFDKQGNVIYKRYGIINRDELVAVVEKALQ